MHHEEVDRTMTDRKHPNRSKSYTGFPCPEYGGCEFVQDPEEDILLCGTCGLVLP